MRQNLKSININRILVKGRGAINGGVTTTDKRLVMTSSMEHVLAVVRDRNSLRLDSGGYPT